ncbi:MAG TPA: hypothetical protein P5555_13945 [Candidatus Paceibacterota bacterium]|nr:hypothetical protein [Candidatus Paceibacterota bacterium]
MDELCRNVRLLMPHQQRLLVETLNRIESYPQRFARKGQDYSATAGIVLMADAGFARQFCMCSIGGGHCGRWRICPFCCHLKRKAILSKFLPTMHRSNCYFSTLSFDGPLPFEIPFNEHVDVYWAACEYATRTMRLEGYFSGVFSFEAFFIVSV